MADLNPSISEPSAGKLTDSISGSSVPGIGVAEYDHSIPHRVGSNVRYDLL